LSRNISIVEKIIILVIVVGAVLGAGAFFFVIPEYEELGTLDKRIEEKEKQIETAEELQERERTLKAAIPAKRARAETVHTGFYNELTTTQAVDIVQRILIRGGVPISETGIDITDIDEAAFSLQLGRIGRDTEYALRDYSFLFYDPTFDEIYEATFARIYAAAEDGDWLTLLLQQPAQYAVGADANANTLAAKIFEFAEYPALLNRTLAEMLRFDKTISPVHRGGHLDLLRLALAMESSGAGLVTAEFTLHLTYQEYLDFLDYLITVDTIEDADSNLVFGYSALDKCILFQNTDREELDMEEILDGMSPEELRDLGDNAGKRAYEFEFFLYILRPMEIPDDIGNPQQ